jgi:hypothetical protein
MVNRAMNCKIVDVERRKNFEETGVFMGDDPEVRSFLSIGNCALGNAGTSYLRAFATSKFRRRILGEQKGI